VDQYIHGVKVIALPTEELQWINVEGMREIEWTAPLEHQNNNCFTQDLMMDAKTGE